MLAAELAHRQPGSIKSHENADDPFVFSPQLVQDLELMSFARNVLALAARLRPALPTGQGGRPVSSSDATVLVSLFGMLVWQLSAEALVKRLRRGSALADACGYPAGPSISSSQLRRRRDR
jgi:hypothetical protein